MPYEQFHLILRVELGEATEEEPSSTVQAGGNVAETSFNESLPVRIRLTPIKDANVLFMKP